MLGNAERKTELLPEIVHSPGSNLLCKVMKTFDKLRLDIHRSFGNKEEEQPMYLGIKIFPQQDHVN